jgi:hypothetical protein
MPREPGPAESWRRRNRRWIGVAAVLVVVLLTRSLVGFLVVLAAVILMRVGFLAVDRLKSPSK